MSNPKRHHYVGQFLLEGWCGDDGMKPFGDSGLYEVRYRTQV